MEFLETLALMVVLLIGVSFLLFFNKNFIKTKQKISKKDPEDILLKEKIRDIQELYEGQIVQLKKERTQLWGKVNRLNALRNKEFDENEEEAQVNLSEYEIDKEVARPFLQKWGMNADALDNPLLQGILKEKFKDNTELMITLGILRPKGSNPTPQTAISNQSNFDAEFQALVASNQVA